VFGALTKGEACDNLVTAIAKNRKYRGSKTSRAMADVRDKCMRNWHRPRKKAAIPGSKGCPKKVFQTIGRGGRVEREWEGRSCKPEYRGKDVIEIKFTGHGTKGRRRRRRK